MGERARVGALLGCLGAAGAAGCGTDAAPAPDLAVLDRPCADGTQSGSLKLIFAAPRNTGGYTVFRGSVFDHSMIERTTLGDAEGTCALHYASGAALCDTDISLPQGTCPTGATHTVGTVEIVGLAHTMTVPPGAYNPSYDSGVDTSIAPVPPGRGIELRASGAAGYGPFSLAGRGIAPLSERIDAIPLADGQPLTVTWDNPGQPGPARVTVSVYLNTYGAAGYPPTDGYDYISCDVPDTGTATVPASLLTTLRARGFGPSPFVALRRRTVDSTTVGPGCVEFAVESVTTQPIALH